MIDPIDRLLAEHRDIMGDVEPLRRAIDRLRARGEQALPEALPALRRVGAMMATRLLCHARKEDEALFPALERVLGDQGPTGVMRDEHRAIHQRAGLFRETLRQLEEVEHPAIVAGGAKLRELAQGGGGATALAETAGQIVELLDLHFGKEETILFPMAREILSREQLSDVADRMDAIDAETALPS